MLNREKKICFVGTEKTYADLKIRLKHDKLSQREFFTIFVEAYLKNDLSVIQLVTEYKTLTGKYGQGLIKKSKEEIIDGNYLLERLGITDSDRSHMFDVIEGDLGKNE